MDYFELTVWLPGRGSMRDLVQADSLQEALALVRDRYPGCKVEVPQRVVRVTKLQRSADGPKKAAQRLARVKRL